MNRNVQHSVNGSSMEVPQGHKPGCHINQNSKLSKCKQTNGLVSWLFEIIHWEKKTHLHCVKRYDFTLEMTVHTLFEVKSGSSMVWDSSKFKHLSVEMDSSLYLKSKRNSFKVCDSIFVIPHYLELIDRLVVCLQYVFKLYLFFQYYKITNTLYQFAEH